MSEPPARLLPASSPMAFLSDIHGNLVALDAVLAELKKRGVTKIFVAGDLLLGGDDPVGVYKRLRQIDAHCVQGVSDVALTRISADSLVPTNEVERVRAEQFLNTRSAVGELALRYLEQLPRTLRIPLVDGREILMVHGSPADPTVEMSHDLDDEALERLLNDDPADIVVCGGSHVTFQRDLEESRLVNVGSVGASPEGAVAHYTVISPRMDATVVEQNWVDY